MKIVLILGFTLFGFLYPTVNASMENEDQCSGMVMSAYRLQKKKEILQTWLTVHFESPRLMEDRRRLRT